MHKVSRYIKLVDMFIGILFCYLFKFFKMSLEQKHNLWIKLFATLAYDFCIRLFHRPAFLYLAEVSASNTSQTAISLLMYAISSPFI